MLLIFGGLTSLSGWGLVRIAWTSVGENQPNVPFARLWTLLSHKVLAFENLRIRTQLCSLSDDFDFQIDQVVDQMHTKPLKVAPRPVQNVPAGPIK